MRHPTCSVPFLAVYLILIYIQRTGENQNIRKFGPMLTDSFICLPIEFYLRHEIDIRAGRTDVIPSDGADKKKLLR